MIVLLVVHAERPISWGSSSIVIYSSETLLYEVSTDRPVSNIRFEKISSEIPQSKGQDQQR